MMNPEPTPCVGGIMRGCIRGMFCPFGPFGTPKRLKKSLNGLSASSPSSSSSEPAVACILPTVLMLTTAGPAFSASAVKSGRRAAAVGANGAAATGGVAASAVDRAGASSLEYPTARPAPIPAAASASVTLDNCILLLLGEDARTPGRAECNIGRVD